MGQPTQRATNYTARSNIEPAQIVRISHSHSGIDEKRPTENFVTDGRHGGLGRSGPNLKPGTVYVCDIHGLKKCMYTT